MGMVVVMMMFMIMVVIVMMLMVMMMLVIVVMIMVVVMMMFMPMLMSMKILHVMVVAVILTAHKEIAGIDPGFIHPGNLNIKPLQRQTLQGFPQYLLIGPQIKKGRHGHVPADACITLQIQ
jgi:hypothetical protein